MNIVITGATKGIGRAIATKFAKAGFNIAACARNADDLAALKAYLQALHPDIKVICQVTDVADKKQVQAFANLVKTQFTSVEVLVNNAAMFQVHPFMDEPEGYIEQVMATNLYSSYHLSRFLLPKMLEQGTGGYIFNICSVASLQAFTNCAAYNISKHALLGLSRSLRAELKEHNIKVSSVMPGATFTNAWDGVEIDPNRIMPPEDIAETVFSCYHLSDRTVVEDIILRPQLGDL